MRCWPNAGARVPRLPEYGLVRAVRGWQKGAAGRAGCRRPPSRPRPRAASARRPHRHARRARLGPRRRRSEAAVRRPRPSAGRPRRPYRPPWSRRRATTMRTWPRKTAFTHCFCDCLLDIRVCISTSLIRSNSPATPALQPARQQRLGGSASPQWPSASLLHLQPVALLRAPPPGWPTPHTRPPAARRGLARARAHRPAPLRRLQHARPGAAMRRRRASSKERSSPRVAHAGPRCTTPSTKPPR